MFVKNKEAKVTNEYKYPLVADTITAEDNIARAKWLMTNPRLTMGPLVKAYEDKWSAWVGRKYSVACASGSATNLLMVDAILESGKLKNKRVIVPSAAWVTSVAPFIQLGFEPIMCEADRDNFGLSIPELQELLAAYNPATVMLVQVLGVPAHMRRIMELKEKYNFFLLEDACAAMGSSYHGRKVGTFGDMSSVSTYFGHQFSTVEGGIVSTDDKELYTLLFMLRSHGWINGLDAETRAAILKKYEIEDVGTGFVFPYAGYNFRLTDDHAFIGLRQLDRMDWLIEKRFDNHLLYQKILRPHFDFQKFSASDVVSSIHFCALAKSYDERNYIISFLEKEGVETRPFTSGNQGLQPYWFKKYGKFTAPMATRLYECGFFLPNYPTLEAEDLISISWAAIRGALKFRKEGG